MYTENWTLWHPHRDCQTSWQQALWFDTLSSIREVVGEPGEAIILETKAVESANKNVVIDRVESLGQVDEYGWLWCQSSKLSFRTLSVAEVHPWPARKPDCIVENVRCVTVSLVIWGRVGRIGPICSMVRVHVNIYLNWTQNKITRERTKTKQFCLVQTQRQKTTTHKS